MWPFQRRTSPPLGETLREAAQQLHAKASKLETAHEAILTDDLRRLLANDRAIGTAMARKAAGIGTDSGGGPSTNEADMGDLVVADNIRIEQASEGIKALVPIIATCGLAAAGLLWVVLRGSAAPAPVAAPLGPQRCIVDVWSTPDGIKHGVRAPDAPPLWEDQALE